MLAMRMLPPVAIQPPADATGWAKNPIDAFVLAKLKAAGLKPAEEADARTLIRRLSLDVTGLPPSPELLAKHLPKTGAKLTDAQVRALVDELMATPAYVVLNRAELTRERIRTIPDELGLPVVVKPPHEGSSIGITKAMGYSDMQGAVELALGFDDELLFEQCIEGPELTCAVLGQGDDAVALPVVEIRAEGGDYNYENKYVSNDTKYLFGTLPAALEADIQQLVLRAYRLLGCRGWGRADLMLRKSDMKPFLLEMNTSPGMTSHSLVPKAAQAVGVDYPHLCLWLLAQARLDRA